MKTFGLNLSSLLAIHDKLSNSIHDNSSSIDLLISQDLATSPRVEFLRTKNLILSSKVDDLASRIDIERSILLEKSTLEIPGSSVVATTLPSSSAGVEIEILMLEHRRRCAYALISKVSDKIRQASGVVQREPLSQDLNPDDRVAMLDHHLEVITKSRDVVLIQLDRIRSIRNRLFRLYGQLPGRQEFVATGTIPAERSSQHKRSGFLRKHRQGSERFQISG